MGGGTGSGKTTIVKAFTEGVPENSVTIVPLDSYYRDNTNLPYEERGNINYDHPDAFEWDLLIEHVEHLRQGTAIGMPIYNFARHRRLEECVQVKPSPIIVVEGILALYNDDLRKYFNMRVFVDLDSVIEQYRGTVKPMHNAFVEPSKTYADIIIPVGLNRVAVDLVRAKIESIVNPNPS
jgi:uridine kinase